MQRHGRALLLHRRSAQHPLLRGARIAANHPLPKAILSRIVRDEAAHGAFGFMYLDWVIPTLGSGDLAISGRAADRGIASIHRLWDQIRRSPPPKDDDAHPLGWMQTDAYLELAQRAMADNVLAPLRDRGIPVGLSTDSVRAEEPVGLVGVDR